MDAIIGRGCSSKVYDSNTHVLKCGSITKDEVRIMKKLTELNYPHSPKYLGYSEEGSVLAMSKINYRYIDSHSVSTRIRKQIYSAVKKLHDLGVVHNDLHGGNVLYNKDLSDITIIDYGKARDITSIGLRSSVEKTILCLRLKMVLDMIYLWRNFGDREKFSEVLLTLSKISDVDFRDLATAQDLFRLSKKAISIFNDDVSFNEFITNFGSKTSHFRATLCFYFTILTNVC